MRNNMKNRYKTVGGFFSAEAAVMFPFLIILTIFFFYILFFIYDKIMLFQDLNSLEASLKTSERDFYYTCMEIKEQHPYIAADNIEVELSGGSGSKIITIKCCWRFPVADNLMRDLELSREVKTANPYEIMIKTEGLTGKGMEISDDKNKGDK